MRYAAIGCNLLTGLYWGGLGLLLGMASHRPAGFLLVLFPVLAILRMVTAYGLYKRTSWAYGRSLRTNLFGALASGFLAFGGNLIAIPLVPLEVLGALFTYLSRAELQLAQ